MNKFSVRPVLPLFDIVQTEVRTQAAKSMLNIFLMRSLVLYNIYDYLNITSFILLVLMFYKLVGITAIHIKNDTFFKNLYF